MTSDLTLPEAVDAATLSGTTIAFSSAPSTHRTGRATEQSIQDVIDAAVDRRLRLAAPARREKIPDLKLRTFNGKPAGWQDFDRQLLAHMEHPAFSPGGDNLITTPANKAASCRVRTMLLLALTGTAAHRFDHNPIFHDKGFEMVAALRKHHAPTSGCAIMANFNALVLCEMKPGDDIESYMMSLRHTTARLRDGKAEVPDNLVLLCAIKGLNSRYQAVKDDLNINAAKYKDMTLETLAGVCIAFESLSTSISANAASSATPPPPPPPPGGPGRGQGDPNSNKPPRGRVVHARLAAADTTCPHCLIKHPYINCKKALQAGFCIEKNLEKAKKKLEELKAAEESSRTSGKPPSARRAAAPPPAAPPAPVPQAPPPPPSPPPPPPSPPLRLKRWKLRLKRWKRPRKR